MKSRRAARPGRRVDADGTAGAWVVAEETHEGQRDAAPDFTISLPVPPRPTCSQSHPANLQHLLHPAASVCSQVALKSRIAPGTSKGDQHSFSPFKHLTRVNGDPCQMPGLCLPGLLPAPPARPPPAQRPPPRGVCWSRPRAGSWHWQHRYTPGPPTHPCVFPPSGGRTADGQGPWDKHPDKPPRSYQ